MRRIVRILRVGMMHGRFQRYWFHSDVTCAVKESSGCFDLVLGICVSGKLRRLAESLMQDNIHFHEGKIADRLYCVASKYSR